MADGGTIRPAVVRQIESISSNEETVFVPFRMDPPLNEAEMVAIGDAIIQSTHVKEVDLEGSLLHSPAAAASTFLAKILETHLSIQEVRLSHNIINDFLAEVIGRALKTNTSLKELDLAHNEIGPQGAEALFDGLRHNKSLQIINLGSNKNIGDRGTTALAEALRVNKTLVKLSFWNTGMRAKGGRALASALKKAPVKELNLAHNKIQDEGGKAFAESLSENTSLTRLCLPNTGIGDETCEAFAAALCNNSSLIELGFSYNQRITCVGATALEETLQHLNFSIESIGLEGHIDCQGPDIPENQQDRIGHLCELNIRVKAFFQQVNENIPTIPLGVWPRVLEAVECKPDLLFALLKTKPEVCREVQHSNRRKRRRPDWLRY